MAGLSYERYCEEIVAQTELLRSTVEGADPAVQVPTCPEWTIGRLLLHVGRIHRWADAIVATGQRQQLPDVGTDEDPAALGAWLADGAGRLAGALRRTGPDTTVWIPVQAGPATPAFYARRMTHETLVHRADAALATGRRYTAATDVALDAIDEWMQLGLLPGMLPRGRELLGPGRTLHFHATDASPGQQGEWFVDLTGDRITWRRAHEKAAVAVRGPAADLLLTIYRRRSPRDADVEILGDARLLDFWVERTAFG